MSQPKPTIGGALPVSGEALLVQQESELIHLRRQLVEHDILLSLNNHIASIHDKKDILPLIHPKLKQLFQTEDIFICVMDHTRQTLNPFLRVGGEKRWKHPDYARMVDAHFPVEDGFINTILGADKPLVFDLEEVNRWPDPPGYMRTSREAGLEESLSRTLYDGQHPIGILTLWSEQKQAFTAHHIELMERIADQISIVVTNILATEELQRRERERDLLLSVSRAIASIRDKQQFIRVIQQILKSQLRFSDIAITSFNLPKGTFRVILEYCEKTNQHPDFTSIAFNEYPIADGIHDVIMRSAGPVVLSVRELLRTGMVHIAFLAQAGIQELAGMRLQHNNETVGTMVLLSETENSFTVEDRSLIERVSHHLATAVSNMMANEEIHQREMEKSALLAFSNDIASVRNKEHLSRILHAQFDKLHIIKEYCLHRINEDYSTHSSFIYDRDAFYAEHENFARVEHAKYPLTDGIFNRVLSSEAPLKINLAQAVKQPHVPEYVQFWHAIGLTEVVGVALRYGNEPIGVLFFQSGDLPHLLKNHYHLVKSVCAQISIAVANIIANEKIEQQLAEISRYKEQLEEEKMYLQKEAETGYTYSDIIGSGPEMQKVFHLLSQVSFANSTVLLLGETGTGKELIARAIHNSSPRKDKLMVKVNCAALPASLIESELFGHEKGAFTGAIERRIGKFELANHGTLFLDEIGEMPPDLQVKLLRAIQEKEIERVGGKTTIRTDVRIIAATNRNLEKEVAEGRFRTDLYYRLNVFPITLPPLRDRKEDIPVLTTHFIERFARNAGKKNIHITNKAMKELMAYHWPGNVRELEHLVERSVLLTQGDTLKEVHLPKVEREVLKTMLEDQYIKTFVENERDHILFVLKKSHGKISGPGGAAELLGLPVSTLNSKMKKLSIVQKISFS